MENKREYGDGLEQYVIDLADVYGVDLKGTANSGAKNQIDSDLNHEKFQIECKRTSQTNSKGINNPRLSIKDWIKLKREASYRNKQPALIIGCDKVVDSLVVISINDFLSLLGGLEEDE